MLSGGCRTSQDNQAVTFTANSEEGVRNEESTQSEEVAQSEESVSTETKNQNEEVTQSEESKQTEESEQKNESDKKEDTESSGSNSEDVDLSDTAEKATDAAANMKLGWNLGNSFDATGEWIVQYTDAANKDFETSWGNPVTPDTLMHKLKELGFWSVRIPITWNFHFDENGNIDEKWMSRVKEVVDQAMAEDLYCIINIHHDTGSDGWLRASTANYEKNKDLFAKLWQQIATEFKDYPENLLFEGFNEMLSESNEWNDPNPDNTKAVNSYNQIFVDTVRATGGNNASRNLVCCTYAAAHTDKALGGFSMPTDSAKDHLIAEVHFYSPYEFITTEGVNWTTPISVYDSYVEKSVDQVFDRIEKYFDKLNVPVIVGEFACDDKDNTQDRVKWYTQVVNRVNDMNSAAFIWDNGNGYCMGLLDRTGNGDPFPEIVSACVEAAKE